MILSWPLLVVAAIFFAAWMKPALPNGEWFQVLFYYTAKAHLYTPVFHFFQFHRAFMLAALFLTAVGFILAFVASAQNPTPGLINFCTEVWWQLYTVHLTLTVKCDFYVICIQGTNTVHFVFGIIVFALQIVNVSCIIFHNFSFLVILAQMSLMFLI